MCGSRFHLFIWYSLISDTMFDFWKLTSQRLFNHNLGFEEFSFTKRSISGKNSIWSCELCYSWVDWPTVKQAKIGSTKFNIYLTAREFRGEKRKKRYRDPDLWCMIVWEPRKPQTFTNLSLWKKELV